MTVVKPMTEVRKTLFAAAALLALLVPLLAAQAFKLKVMAEIANIRRGPDIGTTLLRQVPEGTILESEGKEGEWYLVRFPGEDGQPLSGYVHQSLVVRLLTPPPADQAPARAEPIEESPKTPDERRPVPRSTPRTSGPASSVRLYAVEISGGFGLIAGGDPNRAIQGLADYYQAVFGRAYDGRVGSARLGPSLCLTFDYWAHPRAGIGLAVDYVYAGDEVVLGFPGGAAATGLEIVPELDSIPVRVHFAFAPTGGLVVKTGLEYHFARCRYLYRLTEGASITEWTGSARGGGLGFYASASLERLVAGPVSVFVEAAGRYARFSGFDGKATLTSPDGTTVDEEGPLYYHLEKVAANESVPLLFVRKSRPSGPTVTVSRRARVDYSGGCLRAGLRIRF
jgi:hypothetical protein